MTAFPALLERRSPLQPFAPTIVALPPAGRDEPATVEPTDELLLARIARRDLAALDTFYARYSRVAFSVAYHVLCNAESAEDVVQEVFLTVWRRADSYIAGRGSARTWLLSIVRHRAIDVARARAARPQGTPLDEVIGLAAPDDDPSAEALRRIEAANVRAALDCLPIAQREVVELAFFSGLSYPEIAEQTGVPLGTVKSRMRLALERLRGVLTAAA
jgi:RNA polymerase sigma-70 factor (ECF subfamily)